MKSGPTREGRLDVRHLEDLRRGADEFFQSGSQRLKGRNRATRVHQRFGQNRQQRAPLMQFHDGRAPQCRDQRTEVVSVTDDCLKLVAHQSALSLGSLALPSTPVNPSNRSTDLDLSLLI